MASSPLRNAAGAKGEAEMGAADVMQWLHGHLGGRHGGGQVAEIDESTRKRITSLAKYNIEADKRAKWQAKEARARTDAYQSQEELLARFKLGVSDMPPEVASALDSLSQCSILLGCPDASTPTLLAAMSEMEDEISALEHEHLRNKAMIRDTRKKREECDWRLEELRSRERGLEEEFEGSREEHVSRARKVEYINAKARQYENALRNLKQELRSVGASDSIYHSTIVAESARVQEIHAEIRQLQARVAHYDGLPPDMRLAKDRVHEALAELELIDRQLQEGINDMVVGA